MAQQNYISGSRGEFIVRNAIKNLQKWSPGKLIKQQLRRRQ